MQLQDEVELVDAAARLRVAYHTAHRLVLTGQLKGERRDGHWFVDANDLDRLLAARTRKGDEQA